MGFSPLANMKRKIPENGNSSARNSAVRCVLYHHNAGVNAFTEASNPNRTVSANYWITNEGDIIPQVDESRRAFTSGHSNYPEGARADHRSITLEISNSPEGVRNGTWAISPAAKTAVEKLTGDIFKRFKLGRVIRSAAAGVCFHSDFVPTECPGGWIRGNIGSIIDNAERYRTGSSTPEGDDMKFKDNFSDKIARGGGRKLKPGSGFYLNRTGTGNTWTATNVAGPAGEYIFFVHVYAEGTPGDIVDVHLLWQSKDGKGKDEKNSPHYVEKLVIPEGGVLRENFSFSRYVGERNRNVAVFARADAPKSNKGTTNVSLFDVDSRAW